MHTPYNTVYYTGNVTVAIRTVSVIKTKLVLLFGMSYCRITTLDQTTIHNCTVTYHRLTITKQLMKLQMSLKHHFTRRHVSACE